MKSMPQLDEKRLASGMYGGSKLAVLGPHGLAGLSTGLTWAFLK